MYYLYILLCANNSLYTGITNNIEKRLRNHIKGCGSQYVYSHLPFKHIYTEEFIDKHEAAQREKQIKGWKRSKKLIF